MSSKMKSVCMFCKINVLRGCLCIAPGATNCFALSRSKRQDIRLYANLDLSKPRVESPPKLPIILCHGLMGFDTIGPLQYWRGIKDDLEQQGCTVAIARVPPTASIKTRAEHLQRAIEEVLASINESDETQGWPGSRKPDSEVPRRRPTGDAKQAIRRIGKVHLIAHSMGGLDARYYVTCLGGHDRVLSLTTIATPHRGSSIATWVNVNIGARLYLKSLLNKAGVETEAFDQLTPEYLQNKFNPHVPDHPDVSYFSLAGGGKPVGRLSPMRVFNKLLTKLEGPNDGLVSQRSAHWGTYLGTLNEDHLQQIPIFMSDCIYVYRSLANFLGCLERERLPELYPDAAASASHAAPAAAEARCLDHVERGASPYRDAS
eukprot:TRINITY_DN400_c13_g1_i1.p1 TRINITY_DN400_c13_g1~~TRINITY_DN400_c13_g1_i1.p1  ORF type:complete len:374 (+),score=37.66 TRINITY_DN400_c13_g1_i1:208-1329(+)